MRSNTIGVVIVTFNRLKQLKTALNAYEMQSLKPKYMIVVNNNSNDGTSEYLNEWCLISSEYSKYVINLENNIGGSGGFYEGLKKSLNLDADWIWVADDDAYPDVSAISIADGMINDKTIVNDQVSAICGAVINHGNIDYMHRRRISTNSLSIKEVIVPVDEYNNKFFELHLFSYVGSIINKGFLKQVGLPKKDYFIYYDDTEHSMRLAKKGRILCFPAIKITHDNRVSESITWKTFYLWRNRLDFYKTHFPIRYQFIRLNQIWNSWIHILTNRKVLKYKIRWESIKGTYKGNFVLHKIYRPGWQPDKE